MPLTDRLLTPRYSLITSNHRTSTNNLLGDRASHNMLKLTNQTTRWAIALPTTTRNHEPDNLLGDRVTDKQP